MDITVVKIDLADDVSDFGLLGVARCEDVFNNDFGANEVCVAVWGFYVI